VITLTFTDDTTPHAGHPGRDVPAAVSTSSLDMHRTAAVLIKIDILMSGWGLAGPRELIHS
jgi:hypothetical protein